MSASPPSSEIPDSGVPEQNAELRLTSRADEELSDRLGFSLLVVGRHLANVRGQRPQKDETT